MEYIGLLGGVIMFAGGMWYLERQRVQAAVRGEHFVAGPRDHISLDNSEDECHPRWQLAAGHSAIGAGTADNHPAAFDYRLVRRSDTGVC